MHVEVRKETKDTSSTKGDTIFLLLLHPRPSVDPTTTMVQYLSRVPEFQTYIKGDLSERRPPVLCFIKEGYAKIDTQPQVNVKKHLDNQDVVPSATQCSKQMYTACLSIFKVKTIPLIVSHKTEITIVPVNKSQK